MPRPNRSRSIESESNLAARIRHERARRGLSYEGLAKVMTEAGCSIQGSAIYRIEKGDPPRRVTVDELVALSTVFGVEILDLLRPIELVERMRAREIAADLHDVVEQLDADVERMLRLFLEYNRLAVKAPELLEYINNHHRAADKGPRRILDADEFSGLDEKRLDAVRRYVSDIFNTLMLVARDAAKANA